MNVNAELHELLVQIGLVWCGTILASCVVFILWMMFDQYKPSIAIKTKIALLKLRMLYSNILAWAIRIDVKRRKRALRKLSDRRYASANRFTGRPSRYPRRIDRLR